MNSVLISIGVAFILLFSALVGAPYFVDWNAYRAHVERELSRVSGQDVRIGGDLSVRALPLPVIRMSDVVVGDDELPLLSVKHVTARIGLTPLLTGDIEIQRAEMAYPMLSVPIGEDGSLNIVTAAPVASQPVHSSFRSLLSGWNWRLNALEISNGVVAITDPDGRARFTVGEVKLRARATSLRGPFRVDGQVEYDGDAYRLRLVGGRLEPDGGVRIKLTAQDLNRAVTWGADGQITLGTRPEFTGSLKLRPLAEQEEARAAGSRPQHEPRDLAGMGEGEDDAPYMVNPDSYGSPVERVGSDRNSALYKNDWHLAADVHADFTRLAASQISMMVGNGGHTTMLRGTGQLAFAPALSGRLELFAPNLNVDEFLFGDRSDRVGRSDQLWSRRPTDPASVTGPSLLQLWHRLRQHNFRWPGLLTVSADVDRMLLHGSVLEHVRLRTHNRHGAWHIEQLEFGGPGMTDVTLSGGRAVDAQFDWWTDLRITSAQPASWLRWLGTPSEKSLEAVFGQLKSGLHIDGKFRGNDQEWWGEGLSLRSGQSRIDGHFRYKYAGGGRFIVDADAANFDVLPYLHILNNQQQPALDAGVLPSLNAWLGAMEGEVRLRGDNVRLGDWSPKRLLVDSKLTRDAIIIREISLLDMDGADIRMSSRLSGLETKPHGRLTMTVSAAEFRSLKPLLAQAGLIQAWLALPGLHGEASAAPVAIDLDIEGDLSESRLEAEMHMDGLMLHVEGDLLPLSRQFAGLVELGGEYMAAKHTAVVGPGQAVHAVPAATSAGAVVMPVSSPAIERDTVEDAPAMVSWQMGADLLVRPDGLALNDLVARVGVNVVKGDLSVAWAARQTPLLRGQIVMDSLSLPWLLSDLHLYNFFETRATTNGVAENQWMRPFLTSYQLPLDVELELAADRLFLAPALPAEEATFQLRVADDVMRIDRLNGRLAGGQLSAMLRGTLVGGQLSVDSEATVTGVQFDEILPLPVKMNGRIDMQIALSGQGRSWAAIVRGLDGTVDLGFGPGKIQNLDDDFFGQVHGMRGNITFPQAAAQSARFVTPMRPDRDFVYAPAEASFMVRDGILDISGFQLEAVDSRLDIALDVDLALRQVVGIIHFEPHSAAVYREIPGVNWYLSGPIMAPDMRLNTGALRSYLLAQITSLGQRDMGADTPASGASDRDPVSTGNAMGDSQRVTISETSDMPASGRLGDDMPARGRPGDDNRARGRPGDDNRANNIFGTTAMVPPESEQTTPLVGTGSKAGLDTAARHAEPVKATGKAVTPGGVTPEGVTPGSVTVDKENALAPIGQQSGTARDAAKADSAGTHVDTAPLPAAASSGELPDKVGPVTVPGTRPKWANLPSDVRSKVTKKPTTLRKRAVPPATAPLNLVPTSPDTETPVGRSLPPDFAPYPTGAVSSAPVSPTPQSGLGSPGPSSLAGPSPSDIGAIPETIQRGPVEPPRAAAGRWTDPSMPIGIGGSK